MRFRTVQAAPDRPCRSIHLAGGICSGVIHRMRTPAARHCPPTTPRRLSRRPSFFRSAWPPSPGTWGRRPAPCRDAFGKRRAGRNGNHLNQVRLLSVARQPEEPFVPRGRSRTCLFERRKERAVKKKQKKIQKALLGEIAAAKTLKEKEYAIHVWRQFLEAFALAACLRRN